MSERMGGHLSDDPRNQERMNNFFVRTGLQGLTNAQRRSVAWVAQAYIHELALQFKNPVGNDAEAIANIKGS